MSHPQRARLAEVLVTRPGGRTRRGSGYLVASGWVLTAAHTVAGAESAAVWLGAPQTLAEESGIGIDTGTILCVPDADLALLPVEPPGAAAAGRVLLGQLDRSSPQEIPVVAAGFPRFKLRPAPGRREVLLREVEYATGLVNAAANVKTGTLKIAVLPAPADETGPTSKSQPSLAEDDRDEDGQERPRSPWEGMSGAAVFAGGRIIGVVAHHHLRESAGVLTIRPLTGLFAAASPKELASWREALPQLTGSADQLANITPFTEAELAERRAQRAAVRLAPRVLVARDDELAELAAFTASEDRWRWVQGNTFAGKTALLAWFALHPPPDLDVAACFLRRTAGDANAAYALDVLNRQLANHADGRPYLPGQHLSQQRDDFLDLLEDAAQASCERGRRLLVIVDGLDEDQTAEPGLAVATWLPDSEELPANAWLLASSRTGVSVDLPGTHALTRHVTHLAASEAARQIANIAKSELLMVRQAGGLVYRLLGLLTAAVNGLTTGELTDLVRQTRPEVLEAEVADTLEHYLARTVPSQRERDVPGGAVWAFSHEALLGEAGRQFGGDLPHLRGEIVEWCHQWVLGAETQLDRVPGYVVRHYAERLTESEAWTDQWNDLVSPLWATLRGLSLEQYLPHREDLERLLRAAQRFNRDAAAAGQPAPAVAAAVAATIRLAEIEGQSQSMSPDLAAALIETGRWSAPRALKYLASIRDGTKRAVALGTAAAALDPRSDVVTAVLEMYEGLDGEYRDERGQAALGVARLLVAAGRGQDAAGLAENEAARGRFCEACNASAGALAGLPPPRAGRLLMAIGEWSAHLSDFDRWHFAERLCERFSRHAAQQALSEIRPDSDAGDFLIGLLRVDDDDDHNLAAAIRLAATWTSPPRLAELCREILVKDGFVDELREYDEMIAAVRLEKELAIDSQDFVRAVVLQQKEKNLLDRRPSWKGTWEEFEGAAILADLASVAPAELGEAIFHRSRYITDGDRMRVFAGLLVADHERLAPSILAELTPDRLPFQNIRSHDDRYTFLADLARSGHGQLAVDYLKAARADPHDMEAVAPHLGYRELTDLLELASHIEPAFQGRARAAILPSLIRARPTDPIDLTLSSWLDAVKLARIAAGWTAPGNELALPEDPWLRLAAALVAATERMLPVRRCLEIITSLPRSLVIPVLAAAAARLPLDADSADNLIEWCRALGPERKTVNGTELMHTAFRALAAQRGSRATFTGFAGWTLDPWLVTQLIVACGDQLIAAGLSRAQLLRASGSQNGLIARAALVQHAENPDIELRQIIDIPAAPAIKVHQALRLADVLQALPPTQQPLALGMLVDDEFLDGSRPIFARGDTWAVNLTPLVRFMSPRQLQAVNTGIKTFKEMGSGRRSELVAEIAIRWARVGNFGMFQSALTQASYSSEVVARVLTGSVMHVPAEHLTDWYKMADQGLDTGFDARRRAVLWALARFRSGDLDRDRGWMILDAWLPGEAATRRAKFGEPWQVLVDLVGYVPAIAACSGPHATSRLGDLLGPEIADAGEAQP